MSWFLDNLILMNLFEVILINWALHIFCCSDTFCYCIAIFHYLQLYCLNSSLYQCLVRCDRQIQLLGALLQILRRKFSFIYFNSEDQFYLELLYILRCKPAIEYQHFGDYRSYHFWSHSIPGRTRLPIDSSKLNLQIIDQY